MNDRPSIFDAASLGEPVIVRSRTSDTYTFALSGEATGKTPITVTCTEPVDLRSSLDEGFRQQVPLFKNSTFFYSKKLHDASDSGNKPSTLKSAPHFTTPLEAYSRVAEQVGHNLYKSYDIFDDAIKHPSTIPHYQHSQNDLLKARDISMNNIRSFISFDEKEFNDISRENEQSHDRLLTAVDAAHDSGDLSDNLWKAYKDFVRVDHNTRKTRSEMSHYKNHQRLFKRIGSERERASIGQTVHRHAEIHRAATEGTWRNSWDELASITGEKWEYNQGLQALLAIFGISTEGTESSTANEHI
ncbi:uncharacterized protein IL334_001445 [Kwoniella shivajii]|uniref:Uncharacterized protein n=1 Tax=Kwoniella shivajii TaxID=564305 RepID=A0ABZ1CSK4_9TREE|nr:hypothetical protein IL334_001445 [Kwoniella shivajii]